MEKPQNKKLGRPRKRSPGRAADPFERALAAAADRLIEALRERAVAQSHLAMLNGEIPQLERTLAALKAQLSPTAAVAFVPSLLPELGPTFVPVQGYAVNEFAGMRSGPPVSQNEIAGAKQIDEDDDLPDIE